MSKTSAKDDASSSRPGVDPSAASAGVVVRAREARWQAVYLVCKQCKDRSSGPRKFKPKDLAQEIRSQSKHAVVRSRIVMTRCLGLCPKNAAAVACAGPEGVRLIGVHSISELPAALAALHEQKSPDAIA